MPYKLSRSSWGVSQYPSTVLPRQPWRCLLFITLSVLSVAIPTEVFARSQHRPVAPPQPLRHSCGDALPPMLPTPRPKKWRFKMSVSESKEKSGPGLSLISISFEKIERTWNAASVLYRWVRCTGMQLCRKRNQFVRCMLNSLFHSPCIDPVSQYRYLSFAHRII